MKLLLFMDVFMFVCSLTSKPQYQTRCTTHHHITTSPHQYINTSHHQHQHQHQHGGIYAGCIAQQTAPPVRNSAAPVDAVRYPRVALPQAAPSARPDGQKSSRLAHVLCHSDAQPAARRRALRQQAAAQARLPHPWPQRPRAAGARLCQARGPAGHLLSRQYEDGV